MAKPNKEKHGSKIRNCVGVIWGHTLFMTWLILKDNYSLHVQAIVLFLTFITVYFQLVILQDYFFIKTNMKDTNFRQDIRVLAPLLPERRKKHDEQT